MASVAPETIRTVAVTSHGGSVKTTLVETLLYLVGTTTRLGKVDDGTSILDTDPEEHKRRITINMAVASFTHEGTKINLLDTPGFADFAGDQHAALRVADSAIVVVDGSAGLQVGTQSVWDQLEEAKTPRLVLVHEARRLHRIAVRHRPDAPLARRDGRGRGEGPERQGDRAQGVGRREACRIRVQDPR